MAEKMTFLAYTLVIYNKLLSTNVFGFLEIFGFLKSIICKTFDHVSVLGNMISLRIVIVKFQYKKNRI